MKEEEIAVVAQLLAAIKDAINKLEEAQRKRDGEALNSAKKEILNFQKQIEELL